MSSHYLFELGTEELPPKSLLDLSQSLGESIKQSLNSNKLDYKKLELFATPRRLAFVLHHVDDNTPKNDVTVWGPPAKIAFDKDGAPSKAALAFCSRNNIDAASLVVASDGKADKICCKKIEGGEATIELLPSFIESALDKLPIAKRMRWGASRTEFVRPVQWVVLMRDSSIIDAKIFNKVAGNTTRGHRFLCENEITIESPLTYEKQLKESAKVLPSFDERKTLILKQVHKEAEKLGGVAEIDDDLLNEVTSLVEWPSAVSGHFDPSFLSVPAEALISSMKEHQKYFHVRDKHEKLLPVFITVSNMEIEDYSAIITGNERVIRPRLADAAFFFETDLKQTLESRRDKLKSVVFQADLGTVFDKTERIKTLACHIAETLGQNTKDVIACAELCKSDLVSNMVYEFPEMQGIAGKHYAENDGLNENIANGILEHYQPKFAGDAIPATDVGAIVGLADRLDTLSGIFSLGQLPTGSKDPFALRRASVSILRIMVEKTYDIDLADLIEYSIELHKPKSNKKDVKTSALNYVLERFKAWYQEANIPTEVWQAVSAKSLSRPVDIDKRVHAVHTFYLSEAAKPLAAANKRVANILAKQEDASVQEIRPELFTEKEETDLYSTMQSVIVHLKPQLQEKAYSDALNTLSTLKDTVDHYFDKVMVMADNIEIRNNRLALLSVLREQFLNIADIRFLAPGK